NAHPFTHGRWAFAHNGTLHAFDRHRAAIEALIAPDYRTFRGETDSERCFGLFLTRLASRVDPLGNATLHHVQRALASVLDEVSHITDVDVGNGKRSAMIFLVTYGDLLAATRRDRTLFFAAESAESVPVRERPPTRTRLFALEIASEELQGPDVWHEVPQDGVIGIDRDLTFVETSLATLLQRTAGTLARTGGAMPINVQQVPAAIEQAQENALVQQGQGTIATRQFARPAVEHVSLGRGLRVVILLILWAGGSFLSALLGLGAGGLPGAGITFPLGIIVSFFIA